MLATNKPAESIPIVDHLVTPSYVTSFINAVPQIRDQVSQMINQLNEVDDQLIMTG